MKCSEVMAKLEELSPLSFAEGWDNVGLLVGSREREVESVMIALDATDAVIAVSYTHLTLPTILRV